METKADTVRVSPNGWTDAEIGLHWLQTVFNKHTKPERGMCRMLIVDGHESHVSIPFMEFVPKRKSYLFVCHHIQLIYYSPWMSVFLALYLRPINNSFPANHVTGL